MDAVSRRAVSGRSASGPGRCARVVVSQESRHPPPEVFEIVFAGEEFPGPVTFRSCPHLTHAVPARCFHPRRDGRFRESSPSQALGRTSVPQPPPGVGFRALSGEVGTSSSPGPSSGGAGNKHDVGRAVVEVPGDHVARKGRPDPADDEPHVVSMEGELRVGHSAHSGGASQAGA